MKARISPKDDKKDYLRKTKQSARTKYSPEQVRALEGLFISCQYPDTDVLKAISDKLVVSIEKVSIWFQNRRSKFKRQSKNAHTAWMRQQLYNQDTVIRSTPQTKQTEKKHVLTPPEPSKMDCSLDSQNATLYYESFQAQYPNPSPQIYANQQHKQINPTVPDSHHNQKPLSINDFVNDLSQYQYNLNYTSQSMSGIHAAYPSSYARCYPGLYYPYSAQFPYGQFSPIDL